MPQPDAGDAPAATPEAYERRCTPDSSGPLSLPGWTRWDDFPSGDVRRQAREVGLFVEVWEKACPPIVAVAFRGTEFTSLPAGWFTALFAEPLQRLLCLGGARSGEKTNEGEERPPVHHSIT